MIPLPLVLTRCANIWSMSKETHWTELPICSSRFCIPWFYVPVNHSLMLTDRIWNIPAQWWRAQLGVGQRVSCIARVNIKVHIPKRRSKSIRRGSSSCANEARGGLVLEYTQSRKRELFLCFSWRRRNCIPSCPSGSPCFHPSFVAPNRLSNNLLYCTSCLLSQSSFLPRQTPGIPPAKTPDLQESLMGRLDSFYLKHLHEFSF